MGYMESLGRIFDLSLASSGARDGFQGKVTGFRVSTKHATSFSVVLIKGVGTPGDDPVLTISSATQASGGTLTAWPNPASGSTTTGGGLPAVSGSQVLANTPQWYYKKATGGSTTVLAGSETWTRVYAASAAGVLTLTGEATNAGIYVIPINPTDPVTTSGATAGGFPDFLEVDIGSFAHPQYVALLYILGDLEVQEDPTRMFHSQT